jgi:uncharacterized protein (TIGR02246 family)
MRCFAVSLATISLMLIGTSATAQESSEDERQIRAIITDFSDVWARADVQAFESLLTEDAEWVVRSGTFLKGRPEVVAYHADLMSRNFSGSHVVWQPVALRFLRPDVVVAHVAAQLTLRDGTERPPGMVTLVFAKGAGRWRITAVQNTDRTSR